MKLLPRFLTEAFWRKSPLEVAAKELFEAKLSKLQSETGREYAEAMCNYHSAKIRRLEQFLRREDQSISPGTDDGAKWKVAVPPSSPSLPRAPS